jgi:formylmethanofuran dehydrogenase subunit E
MFVICPRCEKSHEISEEIENPTKQEIVCRACIDDYYLRRENKGIF